jgi:hypothetical protein
VAKTWVSAKEMHNRAIMADPDASDADRHRAAHAVVGIQTTHHDRRNKERMANRAKWGRRLDDGAAAVGQLGKGWLW